MTLLPPGVKVHLAFGYTDMRKGIDGLAMLVQWRTAAGSLHGAPVRVPGSEGQSPQDRVLGWDWIVPLHQAARAGRLPLAIERGARRDAGAELGAAVDADRRR